MIKIYKILEIENWFKSRHNFNNFNNFDIPINIIVNNVLCFFPYLPLGTLGFP